MPPAATVAYPSCTLPPKALLVIELWEYWLMPALGSYAERLESYDRCVQPRSMPFAIVPPVTFILL